MEVNDVKCGDVVDFPGRILHDISASTFATTTQEGNVRRNSLPSAN